MSEHEDKFVEVFVRAAKRNRFREQLASQKHRRKATATLGHTNDLDTDLAESIQPDQHTPEGIYAILNSKGAPSRCHLISEDAELDGKDLDLKTALEEVIGYGNGTFVSCVPGKLGFFESAEAGLRFIFEKR